jgi:hypothetical protein
MSSSGSDSTERWGPDGGRLDDDGGGRLCPRSEVVPLLLLTTAPGSFVGLGLGRACSPKSMANGDGAWRCMKTVASWHRGGAGDRPGIGGGLDLHRSTRPMVEVERWSTQLFLCIGLTLFS